MPTKFGLIWIVLRGLKLKKPDITSWVKLGPSQPSLAWFGLAWVGAELSNSNLLALNDLLDQSKSNQTW